MNTAQMQAVIRVLIADDHQLFRESLRGLLESEPGFIVVGEASNGREGVNMNERVYSAPFLTWSPGQWSDRVPVGAVSGARRTPFEDRKPCRTTAAGSR